MENRQLLEKIYGKNIVNMLQKKYFEIVENPDFVVEGAGDYCGDRLVFRVRLIEKRIEIEYESYSCAILYKSGSYDAALYETNILRKYMDYFKRNITSKQILY